MPKETMISGDWWKEVKSQASPKYIEWAANKIEVIVDFDKGLHKELNKDPLLLQKLSDAGSAEYKKFIANAAQYTKRIDTEIEKAAKKFESDRDLAAFARQEDFLMKEFMGNMEDEAGKAETAIAKAIMAAWEKYKKTKKDYRDYKIRSGVKLGIKFASLGFAIGKLVGSVGADVLAWRTLVRDSIKSVTEIGKLIVSAETFRKGTDKQLRVILAWHAKLGDGKGATASEVGLALLKVVIGTDCEMTLDAVSANVKQYRNKAKGVELSAHSAAKKLNLALNRMGDIPPKLPRAIAEDVEALAAEVRKLLEKVTSLTSQVSDGIDWADTVDELVTDLKKAKSVTHAGKLVRAAESLVDIGTSVGGWVQFADKGGDLATKILAETTKLGKAIERHVDDVKAMAR